MLRQILATCALCMACRMVHAQASGSLQGFSLPKGYVIQQVAAADLANDIYCLTFGPTGELVVSGRGYIRKLLDKSNDGIFDQYETVTDHPRDGAMGLLIKNDHLYYVGDNGIHRIRWPVKSKEQPTEQLARLKTGGEHDAHAITCGSDRYFYVLCGNTTTLQRIPKLSPESPIKKPVGGFVLRISPDFTSCEIICDGLRNAYSFDWNLQGELFTFDSDNERCMGLPWYEGCRFYRIQRGGHYGWRNPQPWQFYRLPPYHPRVIAPLLDLGRGSPTGVVCYRHTHFPEEIQNSFFLLDWTFGQIHLVRLQQQHIQSTVFLKVTSDLGFAPTSAAVHPITGELYVSCGGRGTQGAIYRIRYTPVSSLESAVVIKNSNSSHLPDSIKVVDSPKEWLSHFENGQADEKTKYLCLMLDVTRTSHQLKSNATFKEAYQIDPSNHFLNEPERSKLLILVRRFYPSQDRSLNRELSRALAILGDHDSASVAKLTSQITATSSPVDDVHHLFVLACCSTKADHAVRTAIAQAIIQLEQKYHNAKLPRERNWSQRLKEAVQCLLDSDPQLGRELAEHPEFNRVDQLIYLNDPRIWCESVATRFTKLAASQPDLLWNSELVQLLISNPSMQTVTLLRKQWNASSNLDIFIPALVKYAESEDHVTLMKAMQSTSAENVQQIVIRLNSMKGLTQPQIESELPLLLDRSKYWQSLSPALALQIQLRLKTIAKLTLPEPDKLQKHGELETQLKRKFPTVSFDSGLVQDISSWVKLRGEIPWSNGSLQRGEKLFHQYCHSCHTGTTAVGPDLQGVGKRFSRDDLLHAIINPNKDVSPRYQTSLFTTHEGKVYTGIVIYEAIDGIILQTSDNRTVRIRGDELADRRTTSQSLMPAGLLDRMSNLEIADLIRWLQK